MYSIYSDDKLIYSPMLSDNGFVVTAAAYEDTVNSPGTFSFSIPVTNPNYDKISMMRSLVTVKDDETIVWRGRPIDISRDFWNTKTVVCESEMAFLYDIVYHSSVTSWRVKDLFDKVIEYYNGHCSSGRQFMIQESAFDRRCDYANDVITADWNEYNWPTVYDALMSGIVNVYGGYLKIKYRQGTRELSYRAYPDRGGGKRIIFGKNLVDLDEQIDYTEVFTRLHAFGAEDKSTGIRSRITLDADEESIKKYGVIEKAITFDDVTNSGQLQKIAKARLASATALPTSINIKGADMRLLDTNAEDYEIGEEVLVESPPHNLKNNFICTRKKVNILDPSQSEFTFGVTSESLTDRIVGISKRTF